MFQQDPKDTVADLRGDQWWSGQEMGISIACLCVRPSFG